jgi:hypothetical protein
MRVFACLSSSANPLSAEVTFYRTLEEDGPWPSQVDGILGLAFPALNCNPTCTEPAYETLLRKASGASGKLIFAMCFGDRGGKLVLGGDGRAHGLIRASASASGASGGGPNPNSNPNYPPNPADLRTPSNTMTHGGEGGAIDVKVRP